MKAVLYARVSRSRKATSMSIEGQLRELRQYAKDNGWEVYAEFVDESLSGKNDQRPGFQKIIELAMSGEQLFSAVIVWKFSRFSRRREDSVYYKDLLQQHGVTVISVCETTGKPHDKLVESILESVDEYYLEDVAENTRLAMRENALRNFFNGGKPPVGYRVSREGDKTRLAVCSEYAVIVEKIFLLCIAGNGAKEIAKILHSENSRNPYGNLWSVDNVQTILQNSIYTRALPQPIISEEMFQEAQQCIEKRTPKIRQARATYLLSGFLYCGNCGSKMSGQAKTRRYSYYCCYKYSRYGKHACPKGMVNCDKIETAVIAQVFAKIQQKYTQQLENLILSELSSRNPASQIQCQISIVKEKLRRYFEAFEMGIISMEYIAPRIEVLHEQIQDLQQRLRTIPNLANDTRWLQNGCAELSEVWQNKRVLDRKHWLRHIVQRVEYSKKDVVVKYRCITAF